MARDDEVLDGGLHARAMVVDHGARTQAGWQLSVDDDHRPVRLGDGVEVVSSVSLASDRMHAVHPAALEEADVLGIERGLVLGVHEQQRVARAPEHRLGAQHDVRHSGLEMSASTKPTDSV